MTEYIFQHEEVVFEITQEYLNKNRCFNLENIIPYINVRLKKFSVSLNYDGIREILKSLIKKKIILERSKLTKNDILNNTNRKKIYDFITNNPGVYFYQIARELELSNYILAWHIKILMKFEYIKSDRIENHEVFFNIKIPTKNYELYYLLSKKYTNNIIELLKTHPEGITKTQICKKLGIHATTFSKYLLGLEKYKIVFLEKLSRKTLYTLNEKIYDELKKIIV